MPTYVLHYALSECMILLLFLIEADMKFQILAFCKKHYPSTQFYFKRLLAFAIDVMVYGILLKLLYNLFGLKGWFEYGELYGSNILEGILSIILPIVGPHPAFAAFFAMVLVILLLVYLSAVYFFVLLKWQTLGQWLAGIKTVNVKNGVVTTWKQRLVWCLILPPWLLFILYINLPFLIINKRHRSIIDVVAKTKVVEVQSALFSFFNFLRNL